MPVEAMQTIWRKTVDHRYGNGGHMIALTELDMELDHELLHIPKGHKLTRDEALRYGGDVEHFIPGKSNL